MVKKQIDYKIAHMHFILGAKIVIKYIMEKCVEISKEYDGE